MAEARHTKSPWRVGPVDDTVVTDASGREVAAVDGDYNNPDEWPEMEANARLIAAAPDLLAALKEHVGECFDPNCEMCARHEALIAKVEGFQC